MGTEFPNLDVWLAVLRDRDNGMLLVALIAVAAVAWLVNCRFLWPRLLPLARGGLLVGFYLSAIVLVLVKGISR